MKTKEFIEEIKKLGYNIEFEKEKYVSGEYMWVVDNKGAFMRVNTNIMFLVDTDYFPFRQLDDDDKRKLLNVALEYIKTPLEEREEPKKYYLRLPEMFKDRWAYLNYRIGYNDYYYFFDGKNSSNLVQTQFTQEEIDNLPNQKFIKTLIKEEV